MTAVPDRHSLLPHLFPDRLTGTRLYVENDRMYLASSCAVTLPFLGLNTNVESILPQQQNWRD